MKCVLFDLWGNHHSFISEMGHSRHNDHQKDVKRYSGGQIILDGIKSALNFIVKKIGNFVFGGIFSVFSRISSEAYRALTWSTPMYYIYDSFLCPGDRRSGGILFLSYLSFCHSVLLSETLTLLRTFELLVLEFIHFTWVFVQLVPTFFYSVTLTLEAYYFYKKTITLQIIFKQWMLELEYSMRQGLLMGTNNFDLVTLTLEFDLLN